MIGYKYPDALGLTKYIDIYADVELDDSINGDMLLKFSCPATTPLEIGMLVFYPHPDYDEDQGYIIKKISYDTDSRTKSIECMHMFEFFAKKAFIPNLGNTSSEDLIGVLPYTVAETAKNKTAFFGSGVYQLKMYDESDLEELGLKWCGGTDEDDPEFTIDYESTDKTTLWDALLQIIEIAGRGEIYMNNNSFAIVERLGNETDAPQVIYSDIRSGVKHEIDVSNMITILYPYGDDGLEITNAEDNTDGHAYIKSSRYTTSGTQFTYTAYAGYKDYEISDPDDLYTRALWEFDEDNKDRIDQPDINISGSIADLMLPDTVGLGDDIGILLDGEMIYERIISIQRYPNSDKVTQVSIGRVEKDMYFYLNQIGLFAKRYKAASTSSGAIAGTHTVKVSSDGTYMLVDGYKILIGD